MSDDTKAPIGEDTRTSSEYDKLKNTELYDLCIERSIVFDPKTPRPALIDALKAHDAQEAMKQLVKIKIFNQDSIGGSQPVQVGWNEKKFIIPREMEVEIPMGVLKVMESCVERKNEVVNGRSVIRDYPRFSYTVIK